MVLCDGIVKWDISLRGEEIKSFLEIVCSF